MKNRDTISIKELRRKKMKRTILLVAAILSMSACQTKSSDKQEIKNLLFTYRDALNASDVSKVLPLYTEDGIFMQ